MNRYLLLRDNKQTGPYTVSELVQKGIKAYDLVWLDGKSAAWRYPSEIEELKAYAPVVEEQPFDRFFKKTSSQSNTNETLSPEKVVASQPAFDRTEFEQSALSTSALEKAAFERIALEKAAVNEAAAKKASIEKVQAEKAAMERSAIEKATMERAVMEKAAADKAAFETAVLQRAALEKEAFEKSVLARVVADKEALDKAMLEKATIEKALVDNETNEKALWEKTLPPQEVSRKIYVTLPGAKNPAKTRQVIAPAASLDMRIAEGGRESNVPSSADVPASSDVPVADSPVGGERDDAGLPPRYASVPKYKVIESSEGSFSSRFSGDDLFTDTVTSATNLKRKRTDRKNAAITIIAALCLLLGGVIIGLVISNSRKESARELDELVKQIQERHKIKQLPPPVITPVAQQPHSEVYTTQSTAQDLQPAVVAPTKSTSNAKTLADSQPGQPVKKTDQQPVPPSVSNTNNSVAFQPAVVPEEKQQPKAVSESARKNLRQLVSVNSNKYKTGVLGGISDLVLTVVNKSEYELDQVEVQVEYLGPERRVIKTQIIVFNNVKPGKELTQEVPRTNRGVTVNTSIKVINAKSLGAAYSAL